MLNQNEEKTYALFSNAANRKLITELEKSGRQVLQIPELNITKVNSQTNSAIIKDYLSTIDWLIFTDVFSVDYFLQILEENEIDLFELDEKRVLALGESVADQLRFAQLHADVIPKTIDAETTLSELVNYLGKDEFTDLTFLMPSGEALASELRQKILGKNAKLIPLIVYRWETEEENKAGKLKALLKGGAIDEIIVTSPKDIIFLKNLLSSETLNDHFSEIKFLAVNEITFNALRENNLKRGFFRNQTLI